VSGVQRRRLVAAIEGGGTKFVCAVAESPATTLERVVIPTRDPDGTLRDCVEFFRAAAGRHGRICALGIACFGPLQLQMDASDYGYLLGTPKPGWSGVSVLAPFRAALDVPMALDVDVGAAARGELNFGAGRGLRSLAYVTVGTGIGGAMTPIMGGVRLMHAEMGHLIVRRDPRDIDFAGVCPYHGDCLEGLASGPAIQARWGCDLSALPPGHAGRAVIAGYIAQLALAIQLLHAPQMLVIGGGVMNAGVLPEVRRQTMVLLGGYLPHLRDALSMERLIRAPGLGADSAIVGALQAALETLDTEE
jgi:fructokinase